MRWNDFWIQAPFVLYELDGLHVLIEKVIAPSVLLIHRMEVGWVPRDEQGVCVRVPFPVSRVRAHWSSDNAAFEDVLLKPWFEMLSAVEAIFTERISTAVVHDCAHLPDQVRRHGPLDQSSMACMEHEQGDMVYSQRFGVEGVEERLAASWCRRRRIALVDAQEREPFRQFTATVTGVAASREQKIEFYLANANVRCTVDARLLTLDAIDVHWRAAIGRLAVQSAGYKRATKTTMRNVVVALPSNLGELRELLALSVPDLARDTEPTKLATLYAPCKTESGRFRLGVGLVEGFVSLPPRQQPGRNADHGVIDSELCAQVTLRSFPTLDATANDLSAVVLFHRITRLPLCIVEAAAEAGAGCPSVQVLLPVSRIVDAVMLVPLDSLSKFAEQQPAQLCHRLSAVIQFPGRGTAMVAANESWLTVQQVVTDVAGDVGN